MKIKNLLSVAAIVFGAFTCSLFSFDKPLSADQNNVTIANGTEQHNIPAIKVFSTTIAKTNLINEPGFEGSGAQWSDIDSAGRSIVTTESHSGTSSFEIVLSSSQGREISQVIPTTAGTSYSVSGWAMTDKVDNSNASIRIEWIDSTGVRIGNSKRVLIPRATLDWTQISGTFTAPANAVELRYRLVGGKEPDDSGTIWFDDVALVETSGGSGDSPWSFNSSHLFYNAGNVGIGTMEPESKLHVYDSTSSTSFIKVSRSTPSQGWVGYEIDGGPGGNIWNIRMSTRGEDLLISDDSGIKMDIGMNGNVGIGTDSNVNANAKLAIGGAAGVDGIMFPDGTLQTTATLVGPQGPIGLTGPAGTGATPIWGLNGLNVYYNSGNVGIGTTAPTTKLDVRGHLTLDVGASLTFYTGTGGTELNRYLQLINSSGHTSASGIKVGGILVSDQYSYADPGKNDLIVKGNVGIGTTNPEVKLDVNGTTRVKILEIIGGADIAEPFSITDPNKIPKGSVLIIDEENPGQLKLSEKAYDYRVAGVVSGAGGINPGISLRQEGMIEGGKQVALAGRVYVRAEATKYPIKPGDLLTTSDIPGYAMKVTEHNKALGSIIGKAMTPLKDGNGLVLAIIALQ